MKGRRDLLVLVACYLGESETIHLGVSGAELLRCRVYLCPLRLLLTADLGFGISNRLPGSWCCWSVGPPSVAGEQFPGQSAEQMVASLHFYAGKINVPFFTK